MTAAPSTPEAAAIAAGWIGTPYHHQASVKGVGADCLGLVRGIWRELIGPEPETLPGYSPDWGEASRDERLMAAGDRRLIRIPLSDMAAGDVLLLRMSHKGPAKHVGVLSAANEMIHAYSGRGVIRSALGPSWRRRIVAVYRFPTKG